MGQSHWGMARVEAGRGCLTDAVTRLLMMALLLTRGCPKPQEAAVDLPTFIIIGGRRGADLHVKHVACGPVAAAFGIERVKKILRSRQRCRGFRT